MNGNEGGKFLGAPGIFSVPRAQKTKSKRRYRQIIQEIFPQRFNIEPSKKEVNKN